MHIHENGLRNIFELLLDRVKDRNTRHQANYRQNIAYGFVMSGQKIFGHTLKDLHFLCKPLGVFLFVFDIIIELLPVQFDDLFLAIEVACEYLKLI